MTVPSLKAIAKIEGAYRSSAWMQAHTLYPYPVYEAHFTDNTVGRITFWQEAGKPWNTTRARNLAASIYGKTIARGFIEHDDPAKPWLRIADETAQITPRKPARTSAAQLKALLAKVLEGDETAIEQAQELIAA